MPYIGRFAPSPTGPLHLGSLYTALASFLEARRHDGRWLLRIDDLDTPRNMPGAASAILTCLQAFGLQWDGEVYYQTRHRDAYEQAIQRLQAAQLVYPCTCSRKVLMLQSDGIYPGLCRDKHIVAAEYALRVKTDAAPVHFTDDMQGVFSKNPALLHGDFIIKRRDGVIAYQLAVVVDDHLQQVSHVVRGYDLLDSTPKQIFLQNLLAYPHPRYMHLPVIVDADGCKLSKQTCAAAVDYRDPGPILFQLLRLLCQNPPDSLRKAGPKTILDWAMENWRPHHLQNIRFIPEQN